MLELLDKNIKRAILTTFYTFRRIFIHKTSIFRERMLNMLSRHIKGYF